MGEELLANIPSDRLAELLDFEQPEAGGWTDADLAAMVQHQLHAPLNFGKCESAHAEGAGGTPICFASLLKDPNPPVAPLDDFRRFAKLSLGKTPGPLPREVAAVFYYLSIALARSRARERLSELTVADLRLGLTWIADQKWMPEVVKSAAAESIALVAASATNGDFR